MINEKTDVTIIGAGPAGLFAVFQAGMLGMRSSVVESAEIIGGQCAVLYPQKPIFDIPAHPSISGSMLTQQLATQAEQFKPVYYLNQQAVTLEVHDKSFVVRTSKGVAIESKVVLIAGGRGGFGPNKPPLANIEQYENKSLFYSVQDVSFFKNKKIMIAGGGDSAVDWALNLADVASKLYLVHRRDKFNAAPESVHKLLELAKQSKIEIVCGYQLNSLKEKDNMQGMIKSVTVKNLNNQLMEIEVDALLPFFGITQTLGPIAHWGLDISANHILVKQPHYTTNLEGVYAVGDIATDEGKIKLISTGFTEAACALYHSYSKVFDGKPMHFEYSTTSFKNNVD